MRDNVNFSFLLIIVSLFLLILAFFADKLCDHYIEKEKTKVHVWIFVLNHLLMSLAMQIFILSLADLFISPLFNTSVYAIWISLPNWKWFLLSLYIISRLFSARSTSISLQNNFYYSRIRREYANPIQHFEYILIRLKTGCLILERKLDLLKGISPMPLAILLLGKIFEPSFSLNVQMSKLIFISVIVFICGYFYHFFITWYHYKNSKMEIVNIEENIFAIENPEYSMLKKEIHNSVHSST